ncbi:MAG: DUF559 domain-containing protein [Alphaproteobacteria bacterium]|nr:DUF559 domain-containing protein [Alphaproteobacteria bacterium]
MNLETNAKALRYTMTKAERRLSRLLAESFPDLAFKKQAVITPYIVDFLEPSLKLIIEADGGQHCDNQSDQHRDNDLTSRGYTILRFWNNDILSNPEGIYAAIDQTIKKGRN